MSDLENNKPFTIENAVVKLITNNEFYAHLLTQLHVTYDPKFPAMAGVKIGFDKIKLIINPETFGAKSLLTQTHILEHEVAHFIFGHCGERYNYLTKKDQFAANIAQDAAIHEVLPHIKTNPELDGCVFVEKLREELKNPKIKNNELSEYYFKILKNYTEEMLEKFKGFDEHDFLEDGVDEGTGKSLSEQLLANAIRKTKESSGAGSVPDYAELALERLRKSKTDWRAKLRRFMGRSTDIEKRLSRNRANRRHNDINIPGKKKRFHPRVTAIVDTSGSMCGEPLEMAAAELDKMQKQGYEILLIEADCEVKKHTVFDSKKMKGFNGGGGTAYQPGIDYALSLDPDVILYIGDMDSADKPTLKKKVPFMWVCTNDQKPPASFGDIVRIEP